MALFSKPAKIGLLLMVAILFPRPARAAFTHSQGNSTGTATGDTFPVVLGGAPAKGDVVCAGLVAFSATIVLTSIADSNGNVYADVPNSPAISPTIGGGVSVWLRCLIGAPANASAAVTATFTSVPSGALFVEDWTAAGGVPKLDTGASVLDSTTTTPSLTPSITPKSTNEMFFSVVNPAGAGVSSTNSPWTSTTVNRHGTQAGYVTSASTATSVNYSATGNVGGWVNVEAAFFICPIGLLTLGAGCN